MTKHATTLTKVRREPLDPHWIPTCPTCGDLHPATDRDTATDIRRRHEANVRAAEIGAGL